MRKSISIAALGGLATAALIGGVATRAEPTARLPMPVEVADGAPAGVSDADRRARLNARLADMVREGQGSRLTDAVRAGARPVRSTETPRPTRGPARPAPARSTPSTPAPAPVAAQDAAPFAFVPPAMRTAAAPRGRGYRAPVLDLATPPRVPTDPIECLTHAIYYEARNESEDGQAAVAEVVMNRSRSGRYPRDVCQVVYQRNSRTCQFTFTCDGSIGRGAVNRPAWARAERIAREVHGGRAALLPSQSVNYHANYVSPSWGRRLAQVRRIGAHIFYGAPLDGGRTPGQEAQAAPTQPTGGLQFVRIEALDRAFTTATTPAASAPGS